MLKIFPEKSGKPVYPKALIVSESNNLTALLPEMASSLL